MNRRNGKPKSCEPCRKSKIKCDHTLPTCEKCKSRRIVDKCFYHPAPLTRPRDDGQLSVPRRRRKGTNIHARSSQGDPSNSSEASKLVNSILNGTDGFVGSSRLSEGLSNQASAPSSNKDYTQSDLTQIETGSKLISLLHPFPVIESLIKYNYSLSQVFIVAAPLMLEALPHVRYIVENESVALGGAQNDALSVRITESTLKPFTVPASTTAREFHTLFTGSNLRWEFVGFIFACAGRTATIKPAGATIYVRSDGEIVDRDRYCHEMMMGSKICIDLCRQNGAIVNDLLIWLLWENFCFTTTHYGESSPLVWQRLGDLSTDIYSMGLHRESQTRTDVPFFLQQCRSRMYAAAYRGDKALAIYLGRPPRIAKRYSDVKPPLDISDETLMAEGPLLEEVLSSLDEIGWNPEGKVRPAAFIRLRYIMSAFREEILELSLGCENEESNEIVHKLNDISKRCQQAWDSLPGHLRYNSRCWEDGLPAATCLMLLIVYLDRLNSEFHIQRILSKYSSDATNTLLATSSQTLTAVMVLIQQHTFNPELQRDHAWIVLFYGVSSAGVLAAKLSWYSRSNETLPPWLSRSELIRNLSVLISYLEWVTRPGDGNYVACSDASKMLARILDEALDPQPVKQPEQPILEPSASTEVLNPIDEQTLPAENEGITAEEYLPIDSEAFLDWFDNVDWNNPMNF